MLVVVVRGALGDDSARRWLVLDECADLPVLSHNVPLESAEKVSLYASTSQLCHDSPA